MQLKHRLNRYTADFIVRNTRNVYSSGVKGFGDDSGEEGGVGVVCTASLGAKIRFRIGTTIPLKLKPCLLSRHVFLIQWDVPSVFGDPAR
jgi:hypothetical protein